MSQPSGFRGRRHATTKPTTPKTGPSTKLAAPRATALAGENAERDYADGQNHYQAAEQQRGGRRCQPEGKAAGRDFPRHRRLPACWLHDPHERNATPGPLRERYH